MVLKDNFFLNVLFLQIKNFVDCCHISICSIKISYAVSGEIAVGLLLLWDFGLWLAAKNLVVNRFLF